MKIMHRIADLIAQNAKELAVLGVRDNGTEIGMAIKAEQDLRQGHFVFTQKPSTKPMVKSHPRRTMCWRLCIANQWG